MSGFKISTNYPASKAIKVAWRAAQDLSFKIPELAEGIRMFEARKGHMLIGMMLGPFAPACHFRISAEEYDSGTEIILDENSSSLGTKMVSGSIGMSRVRRQALALADSIAEGLKKEGACVLERKEF